MQSSKPLNISVSNECYIRVTYKAAISNKVEFLTSDGCAPTEIHARMKAIYDDSCRI